MTWSNAADGLEQCGRWPGDGMLMRNRVYMLGLNDVGNGNYKTAGREAYDKYFTEGYTVLYWNGIYAILSEGKHNNDSDTTRGTPHSSNTYYF